MKSIKKFNNFLNEGLSTSNKLEIKYVNIHGEEMILKYDGVESTFFHSDITDIPIPLRSTTLDDFILNNEEQKVIDCFLSLVDIN